MNRPSTESVLREWRYGQPQAERLVGALMHLEGFKSVDPQHPLGGPDGTKDILATRNGRTWLGAAYFPTTEKTFTAIKKKFCDDFAGVEKHNASGFAFFVNHHLSISERDTLKAGAGQTEVEIYHLERIRGTLDVPKGYGIRVEYLRILMTEEEQLAFWSGNKDDFGSRLQAIETKLDLVLARTNTQDSDLSQSASSLLSPTEPTGNLETPTASLSVPMLCWLHRIVTESTNMPESSRGHLRNVRVWLGPPSGKLEEATFFPPDHVERPLHEFLEWWRSGYADLRKRDRSAIVESLAQFHHRFLSFHPFLDGNGRVARILLDQAAREFLDMGVGVELICDPVAYLDSLKTADKGDLKPLVHLIGASLR
ncbi:MAG: hypothetical protein JWQ49_3123 [Edaphobacter sp.]|nr:hypothetical protein [Edaphobacter sp.]